MVDSSTAVKKCEVETCEETKIKARGWCPTHYDRWWRTGDPLEVKTREEWSNLIPERECAWCGQTFKPSHRDGKFCSQAHLALSATKNFQCQEDDCEEPAIARQWCVNHHKRWLTYGSPNLPVLLCETCGCEIVDMGRNALRCKEHSMEAKEQHTRAWIKAHPKPSIAGTAQSTWSAMMGRCYRPTNNSYCRYGAVGIEVCERWHDFTLFLEDMGERPEGCTLDRIHPEGNYEPSNCRWATQAEQTANRRMSVPFLDEDWLYIAALAQADETLQGDKIAQRIYARLENKADKASLV